MYRMIGIEVHVWDATAYQWLRDWLRNPRVNHDTRSPGWLGTVVSDLAVAEAVANASNDKDTDAIEEVTRLMNDPTFVRMATRLAVALRRIEDTPR